MILSSTCSSHCLHFATVLFAYSGTPQLPSLLAQERTYRQIVRDKPFIAHEHVLLPKSGYVEFHDDHTEIALKFLFGRFTSAKSVSEKCIHGSSSQHTSRLYPQANTEHAHLAWSYSTTCTLQLGKLRSGTSIDECSPSSGNGGLMCRLLIICPANARSLSASGILGSTSVGEDVRPLVGEVCSGKKD